MDVTRRDVLIGAAAVVVTAAVPPLPAVAKPASVVPLPAWQVGTPGEMDWRVIFAKTAEEARIEWFAEMHGDEPGKVCEGPCSLDDCECFGSDQEAERQPKFDNPLNAQPDDVTRYRAGWTVMCDRCDYEAQREDGSRVINKKVICEGCLTLDDYKICDPEYAAELEECA